MTRVEITGIGSGLQGVGRLADGRAVFVPGAIPSEAVDIEITNDRGRFCEASLVGVSRPSPDRVAPACPHAGLCGGCQARHMRYARTLELKRQVVADALARIGGVEAPCVRETLGCADPDRTRNKAEYPIAVGNGGPVIGAFALGSHEVVPLKDCLSQSGASTDALGWFSENLLRIPDAKQLRFLVTRVNRTGEMMLVLCGTKPVSPDIRRLSPTLAEALPGLRTLWYCQLNRRYVHALDGRCTHLLGSRTLRDRLFDLDFELSPQTFFQVNVPQAEALYARALEAAGIFPGCGLSILDAYCGAGTITLSAARWAKSAVGIEIIPQAIENAAQNAVINGLEDRAHFICADAAREIPRLLARGRHFDAVILDPPRKGAEAALLDAVSRAHIPVVSYVSCNPATLARDVRQLCASGYRLEWAQPVDMFPWTGHVETVCRLYRQRKDFVSAPHEPKDAESLKRSNE